MYLFQAQIRDYVWRLVYAQMLGYDVRFGHIEAAKLIGNSAIDYKTGKHLKHPCLLGLKMARISILN